MKRDCQNAAEAFGGKKIMMSFFFCQSLARGCHTFAASTKTVIMDKGKYQKIFDEFEKAPLEAFLESVLEEVKEDQQRLLVLGDVSYHRLNAEVVSLEVFMYLAPIEANKCIWVIMERIASTGQVRKHYYTKDPNGTKAMASLKACIDYYYKEEQQ